MIGVNLTERLSATDAGGDFTELHLHCQVPHLAPKN